MIRLLITTILLALAISGAAQSAPEGVEKEFSRPRPAGLPSDEQLQASGARIGKIVIDRLGIFDTSDPALDRWVFRTANQLHRITRDNVVRSQLLLVPGDLFDPRVLRESERLLRSNQFLFDAAVVPVAYADGLVDIHVTTRDLWSIEPTLSLSRSGGKTQGRFGLEDENFLGTGALLGAQFERDLDRDSVLIYFSDRQIFNRWLSVSGSYADNSDGSRITFSLSQPFFELDARRAWGVAFVDDTRVDSLYRRGIETVDYRHEEEFLDVWGGWSAGLRNGWVQRYRAGLVRHDNRFFDPPDGIRAGPVPRDRKLVYPYLSIDVLQDKFIEASNVEQMARTEDFFLGTRLAASIGYAGTSIGADRSAWLLSGSVQRGFGSAQKRMLLLDSQTSGRIESGKTANGVLSARARYFHRLTPKWLRFVSVRATKGVRLDLDRPLQLGGESGLRGFPARYQSGDSLVVLSAEQRYFTDWYPFQLMRVGGAVFADVGRTFGDNPIGGESAGWLTNVGLGLRLALTRGGSKVIHVDLAFPVDAPDDVDAVQFNIEAKRSF
ncbi:MAG: BamA/TamA family outer membrane protein [Gammaproteobacteria bacterium]